MADSFLNDFERQRGEKVEKSAQVRLACGVSLLLRGLGAGRRAGAVDGVVGRREVARARRRR